jgi:amylovoran biosynthesis glycosyltransferase AmsD
LRIIFLVQDIFLGGGGERVTVSLANRFVEEGKTVTIVSISKKRKENIFTIDRKVDIQYLNIDLDAGYKLFSKTKSYFAFRKFIKKNNYPTFILGIGNYPSILVSLLPRMPQIKTIGCQHNSYASLSAFWMVLRWILFRRFDAIVSLTNRDLAKLKRHNPNVWVIPNSVPFFPEQIEQKQNSTVLSVGRIDFAKGHDLMLDVFEKFTQVNSEWNLRIIGDGPLERKIRQIIINKGLSDRVLLLPPTNRIEEEYLNSSVLIMTSRTEALPMVLLEAQAYGLPIVSFDCETGPAEIITNGVDGYLIPPYNITEMTEKLLELCSDPVKREQFGKNGRKNVKRYLPETIFAKWNLLFNHLDALEKPENTNL